MTPRATVAALSADLAAGRTSSRKLVEQALAAIGNVAGEGDRAFLKVYRESALVEADASDKLRALGVVRSPVEGLPVSVKDLFDVAGDVTRAGSKALASAPPAKADAVAVARLRAAGAVILGRTNMVEFAFGGVGLNPHYGTPRSPFERQSVGRIPGGSSSGAGVAVADGMCTMSLGSDTRGSVRIPATFCGVTGFKPTQSRVPRDGAFPLSYTLDSVGPLANSVACCAIYDAILAGEESSKVKVPDPLPLPLLRFIVPKCNLFDNLDQPVAMAFDRAITALKEAGANVTECDAPVLTRVQDLFKDGGVVGPEAVQIHRSILAKHSSEYDPRVSSRISLGASVSAADYIQLGFERSAVIAEVQALLKPYDAMLYPTVAIIPPSVAEVENSMEDYVRCNLKVLRNTGLMNMLDGCAATIPCHMQDEAPVGLSVAGMHGTDKHILAVACSIEDALTSITHRNAAGAPPTKKLKSSSL